MASAADSHNSSPLNGQSPPAAACDEVVIPTTGSSTLASPGNVERPAKRRKRRPQRVRTGCHTCRERHLKCDEALHQCQNCRKSGRVCRRGVRLNFIDTQILAPPCCIAQPEGIQVTFRDDSRLIASEYVGGSERYPPQLPEHEPNQDAYSPLELPGIQIGTTDVEYSGNDTPSTQIGPPGATADDHYANVLCFRRNLVPSSSNMMRQLAANSCARRLYLGDQSDSSAMRSAVNELGCWIDTLDACKHVRQARTCRLTSLI